MADRPSKTPGPGDKAAPTARDARLKAAPTARDARLKAAPTTRDARLKAALQANIGRRKARDRALSADEPHPSGGPGPDDTPRKD